MLWYGPVLGDAYLRARDMTREELEKTSMTRPLVMCVASTVVFTEMLFAVIGDAAHLSTALYTGTMLWAGFTATHNANRAGWQGEKLALTLIDTGYNLVQYLAAIATFHYVNHLL